MSRIGRMPIEIPTGVSVAVSEDNKVTVKGPKVNLVKNLINLFLLNKMEMFYMFQDLMIQFK